LDIIRVGGRPVAERAAIGVIELNPDDIKFGLVDHLIHCHIIDNTLRSASDEIVATCWEIGAKLVDQADISGRVI